MHRIFLIPVAISQKPPTPTVGPWVLPEAEDAIQSLSTDSRTFEDFQFLGEDLDGISRNGDQEGNAEFMETRG
jgi:hypothetical protein